jgi:lipooligosaccharide transport system permease protein
MTWLEMSAVRGVWKHETTLFKRYWASTTFSSVVEPTIYLLAFGAGLGSIVGVLGGYRYIEFLGTGVVATAVLFSSAFAGMFNTFIRRVFQHTYDALLAAPVTCTSSCWQRRAGSRQRQVCTAARRCWWR